MDQGTAIVLAAAIGSLPPTIAILNASRMSRRAQEGIKSTVDDTHAQVVTLNESTIGQLAADTETRRVEHIDHDDRTAQEQHHVDTAPAKEPRQGPSR
jgi:hypothetical protein